MLRGRGELRQCVLRAGQQASHLLAYSPYGMVLLHLLEQVYGSLLIAGGLQPCIYGLSAHHALHVNVSKLTYACRFVTELVSVWHILLTGSWSWPHSI